MGSFFSDLFARLFSRSSTAAERIAAGLEGLADDVEALRADFRVRVGWASVPAPAALPPATTPTLDAGDDTSQDAASTGAVAALPAAANGAARRGRKANAGA